MIFVVSIIIVFILGITVGDFWVSKIINKEYENGKSIHLTIVS